MTPRTTPPAPRFVVREIEGYAIRPDADRRTGGRSSPGLTVWVADDAYLGREIKTWRSEDYHMGGAGNTQANVFGWMRSEAAMFAAGLNEAEASFQEWRATRSGSG